MRRTTAADNLRPHFQGPGIEASADRSVCDDSSGKSDRHVIQLYIWVLIATAVLSWLVAFGIVNRHNPVVNGIGRFCYALTEPVLRPIRRIIP